MTHIIQFNLEKSHVCQSDLHDYIRNIMSDSIGVIAGLQEPACNSNNKKISILPDSNLTYHRANNVGVPRAAIFASNGLDVIPIPTYIDRDISTVRWVTGSDDIGDVIVTSVYVDRETEDGVPVRLINLVNYCDRNKLKLLILTDANAHSPLWGETYTEYRGECFEDFLVGKNLVVHNIGRMPNTWTWQRGEFKSIIDLTITSANAEHLIHEWTIHYDTILTSDHKMITMTFDVQAVKKVFVRNYRKGNWTKFSCELEKRSTNFVHERTWTTSNFDAEAAAFTKDITEVLDKTHPKKEKLNRLTTLRWFDDNAQDAKKKMKSFYNVWRKQRTEATYENYKASRSEYRRIINVNRRYSWREFVESQHNFERVARFNKILNKKSLNSLGLLNDKDGNILDPQHSLNHLVGEHFPGSKNYHKGDTPTALNVLSCKHDDDASEFITKQKVEAAFKSFGSHKAAGVDDIKPIVLKSLEVKALDRITTLYRISLTLGYIPEVWRQSKVIFIPKPGKDDYSDVRSYRALSLMSFLLKGLERIILWELQDTSFLHRPLSSNQHAFRKGWSTESAISNVAEYAESAIVGGHGTLACLLDVKGAFDRVQELDMLEGLMAKETNINIVRWYKHCLRSRYVTATYKGVSTTLRPTRGTPQGGVISPIAWNVACESLIQLFPDEGRVKIVMYADDTILLISGADTLEMIKIMQKAIDRVLQWGREHQLQFAPSKTESIWFTRKQKFNVKTLPMLQVENYKVEYKDVVRYLGVWFDSGLYWTEHLNIKINAAKRLLLKVRNAAGKLWGLSPSNSIWFYRAIVRSMLTYGSIVWSRVTEGEGARKKLTKLQRLALMSMGHYRRGTPTAGLELVTYTIPLWLHIKQEAALAHIRTKHLVKIPREELLVFNKPKTTGHRQFLETFSLDIKFKSQDCDNIPQFMDWNKSFILDEKSFADGNTNFNQELTMFTDGSKDTRGRTGSGLVVYDAERRIICQMHWHLGRYISVFQSELYAIKKAVQYLCRYTGSKRTVTIYADSKAALQALNSHRVYSEQVRSILLYFKEAAKRNTITLKWVKAHNDNEGNDIADQLAKQGAAADDALAEDVPLISAQSIRADFRKCVVNKWKEWWQNLPTCRQTKHFFPSPNKKLSSQLAKGNRRMYSCIVQLITGHNYMNRHNAIVDGTYPDAEAAQCSKCQKGEESTYHIVTECEAYATQRLSCFKRLEMTPPYKFKGIQLMAFLRACSIPVFVSIGMA